MTENTNNVNAAEIVNETSNAAEIVETKKQRKNRLRRERNASKKQETSVKSDDAANAAESVKSDAAELPTTKATISAHANGAAFNDKRPGVLAKLVELLVNASEASPITKVGILDALCVAFPERDRIKMKATLDMQLPSGLRYEKGFVVSKNDKGYWLPAAVATVKKGKKIDTTSVINAAATAAFAESLAS